MAENTVWQLEMVLMALDFLATCCYNGDTGNALGFRSAQGNIQAGAIGLMKHSIVRVGRSCQPALAGERTARGFQLKTGWSTLQSSLGRRLPCHL
jgi:hypothetical protein